MGFVMADVSVHTERPWTEAQHQAVRAGCRDFLRFVGAGGEPDEQEVEEFLREALRVAMDRHLHETHYAYWPFGFYLGTEIECLHFYKLLEVMERHCMPAGMKVHGS